MKQEPIRDQSVGHLACNILLGYYPDGLKIYSNQEGG